MEEIRYYFNGVFVIKFYKSSEINAHIYKRLTLVTNVIKLVLFLALYLKVKHVYK